MLTSAYVRVFKTNIWGSTYSTNPNRLVILQKLLIRIIDKQDFGVHTIFIYSILGSLYINTNIICFPIVLNVHF